MARLIEHLIEDPTSCPYLADERAVLEHRVLLGVSGDELDALLERGWRHFGPDYFRPRCVACQACVPTRIPVDRFVVSRNQRRARKNLQGLHIELSLPQVDEKRLSLYRRWHQEREARRGWSAGVLDAHHYRLQFAFPDGTCSRELAFYDPQDNHRLVAVSLCDETPRAWSAIFFYFDPAYQKRSLGIANVVLLCELARSRGQQYVYLGYRVAACPSLRYKAEFLPQETLSGRPADDETPAWQPVTTRLEGTR